MFFLAEPFEALFLFCLFVWQYRGLNSETTSSLPFEPHP
jgi:hypothetical protein